MQRFIRSVQFALSGLFRFFKSERNGQIQGVAAILAVLAGWWFNLSRSEWLWIVACITAVLSLEMMNSAIEKLADTLVTGYHPLVKQLKDLAAGAVLLAALASLVVAGLIFLPKIV